MKTNKVHANDIGIDFSGSTVEGATADAILR
jgi:hypothetical protein